MCLLGVLAVKLAALSKIGLLVAISALLASKSFAVSDEDKAAIKERIKPVGEVCVEGDEGCAGAVVAVSAEPRSGEEVFNATCTSCHSTGVAGAPKMGDAGDWGARKAARQIDGLYQSALNGLNAMPPKGLCMDCSDDEIKATVDYILSKSL